MSNLTFTIPGNPVPKGRPRAFKDKGGNIRAYTPRETAKAEDRVRFWIQDDIQGNMNKRVPLPPFPDGCLSVSLTFFLETPTSWTSRKRELAESVLCIGRGDADNYAKLILDAMNGVVFTDDRQIVSLHVEKHYSRDPRTEISVGLAAGLPECCQNRPPEAPRRPVDALGEQNR